MTDNYNTDLESEHTPDGKQRCQSVWDREVEYQHHPERVRCTLPATVVCILGNEREHDVAYYCDEAAAGIEVGDEITGLPVVRIEKVRHDG